MNIGEKENDLIEEINSILPEGDQLELLTLIGHLLIEREIYKVLRSEIDHAKYLEDAELQFHQLVKIYKALFYKTGYDQFWAGVKKLNKIRNEYAHNLNSQKVEKLISELLETFEEVILPNEGSLGERYRRSIALLCFLVSNIPRLDPLPK